MGVVTDWKTDRVIPAQAAVDASFQLKVYAGVLSWLHPDIPEWLIRLRFLRYGGAERQRLLRRDDPAIVGLRKEIERRITLVREERRFKARISSACYHCDYALRCPEVVKYSADSAIPSIVTPVDAVSMVQRLVALDRTKKDVAERLRAWVDAHGAIELEKDVYGYGFTSTPKFADPHAVAECLADLGVPRGDVWDALSTSKTAIDKVLRASGFARKAFKDASEKVGKLGVEQGGTKLGLRKKEPKK